MAPQPTRLLLLLTLFITFFQLSLASHKPHFKNRPLADHRLKKREPTLHSNMGRSQIEGGFKPKSPANFETRMVDGVQRVLPKIESPSKRSAPKSKRSAVPGLSGYIQSTGADGTVSVIVGINPDNSYQLGPVGGALPPLPFTVPVACPAAGFNFNSQFGVLGATVNAAQPLRSGPPGTSRKRSTLEKRDSTTLPPAQLATLTPTQIIAYNVYQQIIATELLVVTTIKYTQYAAVNAIIVAAQATFDTIAAARDGGIPVAQRDAPTTAADLTATNAFNAAALTAVNAAYLQAYKACVAAAAQRENAITAYGATLTNPLDASSILTAANAAALAVSTAALAAQGLDPVASNGQGCAAQNACILSSYGGTESTACLAGIATAVTDYTNKLYKIKATVAGINAATLISTGGGTLWTFPMCSPPPYAAGTATPMTAIYTNADGSTASPLTFFTESGTQNAVRTTAYSQGYSAANPGTFIGTLKLNFIRGP